MDSSDHLEEQERSVSHVDELAPELRQRAIQHFKENPGCPVAALVIEDGAMSFGPHLSQRRRPLGTSGLVGAVEIVDRESVRSLLGEEGGADAVAWFDKAVDAAPERLPVVSLMKHGLTIASVALPGHVP